MTGKSHKAIGVATGVAITMYGAMNNEPLLAMSMITAPVGAMLPDIDHDRSKLGSQRKAVMGKLSVVLKVAIIVAVLAIIVSGLYYGNLIEQLITVGPTLGGVFIVMLIANTEWFKNKTKFFTKHRGIMHTLLVPALLFAAYKFVELEAIKYLIIGLMFGYLSHLFSDCLTHDGCPVLWPITKKPIHGFIRTSTTGEYIACALVIGGILWVGYLLSR